MLPDIAVIVPTKGRPERADLMYESFLDTRVNFFSVTLHFVGDEADPRSRDYISRRLPYWAYPTGSMVERTNRIANLFAQNHSAGIIGFAADDNMFVTRGWDQQVADAFSPDVAVVNTNDNLVFDTKGGVFFYRASVIRKLGYFLLPTLEHLYADFAATELGKAANAYRYLNDVFIDHVHPYTGRIPWDDQYRSYNNPDQDARDKAAFYAWYDGPAFASDVTKMMECLA